MKRILPFVFAAIMMAISCTKENNDEPYNHDGSPITQAQALEIVKEDIDEYDLVFISKSIVDKGIKIDTFGEHYSCVPCKSWVVIIDTDPWTNGGRKYLYIYVDAYSGNSDKDSWEWGWPEGFEYVCVKNNLSELTKASDSMLANRSSLQGLLQTKSASQPSNNWAVIISGGRNLSYNYERYWNDCSAIYKCLRNVYNYRRDRIFVIMSDGKSESLDQRHLISGGYTSSPQDLDGDGIDDINYSATKSNITQVFDYLGAHVSSDEQVLIFVTDHGASENGKSYIWLWNNITMSADDFAKEVKKIPSASRKHVVMGQCYSGGFVGPLMSACSNISIATAVSADQESHAMSSLKYDEFLYHWISAAAGKTPGGAIVNADQNGYNGVSAEEMFRYAQDNNGPWLDTPQYASYPSPMGEKYGLSGEEFGYPVFSNPPLHMTSGEDYTASLSNLPASCTIDWTTMRDGNMSFDRVSPSSVCVRKVSGSPMA